MINIEDFQDAYVELSFTKRDTEVQANLEIGRFLIDATENEIKQCAFRVHRKVGFLKACVEVAKQWKQLEPQYHKGLSWSDLVFMAGVKKPKMTRNSLKKIIKNRLMKNEELARTGDVYHKGRYDEDKTLLEEVQGEHK